MTGFLHTGLTYLGVTGFIQNAAVAFSINFGLSVCWLKEYMNFFKHTIGSDDLLFEALISHDFNEVLADIREAIRNGNAIIPMVIYDLQRWHYLNIVGFNNDSVVVLDTDSKLYIWSDEELECVMNTGLHSRFSGLDELLTTSVATLANQITPVNHYNLLLVTQVAISTLKRSSKSL
ncbi:hypothetical protein M3P05_15700 [Sansalvadorimonas sp. 2012CJ34-2]|uniref:Peptidase C39 domain-containing protein n=1 Tax=Parendozoicomonas callyspongiae TaxID=2942213 RepID=A0ABT0PJ26_9GAMM|nr:hypothetical protein [Sansalvadorimonas sp. 2012CJ34-2]MCL6271365.1 hypothetical protein [Sansalvadorimonas sp. 2012CJ34-2]